jgi:hypothetical protein
MVATQLSAIATIAISAHGPPGQTHIFAATIEKE